MPSAAVSAGEKPKLAPGVSVEPAPTPNNFVVREPRSGKAYTLRKLEADLMTLCDGTRTVEEIAALARETAADATPDIVVASLKKMGELGLIDHGPANTAVTGEMKRVVTGVGPAPSRPSSSGNPGIAARPSSPGVPAARQATGVGPAPTRTSSTSNAPVAKQATSVGPAPARTSSLGGMPAVKQPTSVGPAPEAPAAKKSGSFPKLSAPVPLAFAEDDDNQATRIAQMPMMEAEKPTSVQPKLTAAPALDPNPPAENTHPGKPEQDDARPKSKPAAAKKPSSAGLKPVKAPSAPRRATGELPTAFEEGAQGDTDAALRVPASQLPRQKIGAGTEVVKAGTSAPSEAPRSGNTDPAISQKLEALASLSMGAASPTGILPTPLKTSSDKLQAIESLSMSNPPPPVHAARSSGALLPWLIVGVLVVGGGGFFAWSKLHHGDEPATNVEDPRAPAYRVETVHPASRTGQSLMAAGYLSAPKIISMGTTVGGRIQKVFVENGSAVKKDQLLIQFDDGTAKADLRLAEAKLSGAYRALARSRQLFKAEAATQSDVDLATTNASVAKAEADVKKEALEQVKIRAPITGTVIDVPVHEGEVIKGDSTAGGALIKLADLTELIAEADVNEADVPMLRMGQPADVSAEAAPGKTFSGKVKEISQQADKSRGTVLVRVSVPNPSAVLRPGMSVKVAFRQDDGEPPPLLLPRSALIDGNIFVVQQGKAVSRPVTYLSVGANVVQISSGLKEGERVVVEGGRSLRDGARIE